MPRAILFVDDDPNILQGLQRGLRGMRHDWRMHFVASAEEALAALDGDSFDAVVTDMRMPGMDGAALLTAVRERWPATIRIILSGYAQEASVLRTIGVAHQYLAKPSTPRIIADVINRALFLRDVLSSARLRELLGQQGNLPTPPDIFFQLVRYMEQADASATGVADIIAGDLAMTAELLRLTNSAYFSLPARVASPLQAVRVLGFEMIRALVLRIGIFRNLAGNPEVARLVGSINEDSFRLGRVTRRIAKAEALDDREIEDSVSAATLSSLGLLFLADRLPSEVRALRTRLLAGEDLLSAETQVFGATQFQVGAYLLALWGFRDGAVEAVAFAGRPGDSGTSLFGAAAAVHVARVVLGANPLYATAGKPEVGCLSLDAAGLERMGKSARLPVWQAEAAKEK